jgi:hypothetical protein
MVGSAVTHLPVAQASESWSQRTCAAYQAYVRHPSTGRLDAMLTDSENAPYKYVGEDAIGLYKDVRAGDTSYIAKDEGYFTKDC